MTITATTSAPPEATTPDLVRTARTTGLLYLGLAITGMLSYLLIRNQLYVADNAEATLANLTQHEALARLGIVVELGVVITQALVALWFYRLFGGVNASPPARSPRSAWSTPRRSSSAQPCSRPRSTSARTRH